MRTAWSNLVQVRHQMILLSFPKIPEDIRDFSGSSRIKDSEKSSCRCGLQITISVKPLPTFFFYARPTFPSSTPSPYGGSVKMRFKAPATSPLQDYELMVEGLPTYEGNGQEAGWTGS